MKTQILASALALTLLISCNKKDDNKRPIDTAAPEATAMVNSKSCYQYASDKDTVSMTLAMSANNANGELIYKLAEKDRNTGTFSGTFIGDTLFADYTFDSEGTSSVREAVFLKSGDKLIEGNGEMEERSNKMCFKNPKKISFDSATIVLVKEDCR
ncbi:MAG: hypothetical protein EOO48_04845 [Flavobacterium sp.]|nr:MAG: hypothetical protein EOO48_04845 [Flavobacterium sp.]